MSYTGKLERRYFKDPKDAEVFAAKLRTAYHRGERAGVVGPITATTAATAEKILKDAGLDVTIAEAVRTYVDARRLLDPFSITIAEVTKGWLSARKARGDDRTFREAALAFIAEKETQWSDRYGRNIDQTMNALPEWFLETRLPDIDEAVMTKAVKASVSTPTAIETRLRHVKALASGKGRKKRQKSLTLLSVTQCAAMFRACRSREEIRAVALLLFAGIRPDTTDGEISKLDWSAVKDGAIHVSPEVSKTDTERIIPVRKRLARLLRGHPAGGPVMPLNWKRRFTEIRRAAGMNDPKFQDGTRHAFASHHLVAFGEASTQAAMGHTEGSRTLFRHYRRAVTEEAGKKYFGDHGKPKPIAKKATKKGRKP
jgi:hypothetical protein